MNRCLFTSADFNTFSSSSSSVTLVSESLVFSFDSPTTPTLSPTSRPSVSTLYVKAGSSPDNSADSHTEDPHNRARWTNGEAPDRTCPKCQGINTRREGLTWTFDSGTPQDKSVSVPSPPHTTAALTASASSTMSPTWTASTTSSNGCRRSTATRPRA